MSTHTRKLTTLTPRSTCVVERLPSAALRTRLARPRHPVGGNHSTFELGVNYVKFSNVTPTSSEITVTIRQHYAPRRQ